VNTERIAAALAEKYRIERRLGEGGMATVYLAFDFQARPACSARRARAAQSRRGAADPGRRALPLGDGEPGSMGGSTGKTPHGTRVNAVYTRKEWRGRGYATATVAALSQRLLDEDNRFCCLYTVLGNPTSNAIYQRIGYRPACDAAVYVLTDGT
jgi:predicted GNAT family acetyltransferase